MSSQIRHSAATRCSIVELVDRFRPCLTQLISFMNALCSSVNKHAPRYQLNLKENDKPWVTASFKNDVTMRNKAFTILTCTGIYAIRSTVNLKGSKLSLLGNGLPTSKLVRVRDGGLRLRPWRDSATQLMMSFLTL